MSTIAENLRRVEDRIAEELTKFLIDKFPVITEARARFRPGCCRPWPMWPGKGKIA